MAPDGGVPRAAASYVQVHTVQASDDDHIVADPDV